MIPPNHDHTGSLGIIFGTLGYFIGMASEYIPEPIHFWQAVFTAGSSAFVGWVVTKLTNFLWKKIYARLLQVKWVIKMRKKWSQPNK